MSFKTSKSFSISLFFFCFFLIKTVKKSYDRDKGIKQVFNWSGGEVLSAQTNPWMEDTFKQDDLSTHNAEL